MFSIIALMFILSQAIMFAALVDGSTAIQPLGGSFLGIESLTVWATLLIGILCVAWSSNYLSRLAFPCLRSISSLKLFIVVNWLLYLIGSQFNIWIEQVALTAKGSDMIVGLISLLSLATGHVMIILIVLGSLVLGLELIISSLITGERPQLFPVFRPVLVLFAIAATSKLIGEFGLMIILKSAIAGPKPTQISEVTLYFESPVPPLTGSSEPRRTGPSEPSRTGSSEPSRTGPSELSRTGPSDLSRVVPGLRPW